MTGKPSNSTPIKEKLTRFLRKYFLEGQRLDRDEDSFEVIDGDNDGPSFLDKYRKYIGFLIPFCFMYMCWWPLAIRYDFFRLYPTRYEMPLTMILGATVAGMTSEGGGAVAFPSVVPGMTSAAFTIVWMRIVVEWHSIILCTIGSTAGIIFGFHLVDPLFEGSAKKMAFVAIWFSFALALYILNRQKKRVTYGIIPDFTWWKAIVLLGTGFAGGLCSSFAGSGVDICSFSILTLLFRVSEKVATPTSVVLMAANTCVGFYWRQLIMAEISPMAWEYFAVSVPVVVICAPLGSLLASHFHRLVLAYMVYVLEIVAVIGFLITNPPVRLVGIGASMITFGFFFFLTISKLGARLSDGYEKRRLFRLANSIVLEKKNAPTATF